MEQNFQTSFIPKKPMIEERVSAPSSVSLAMIISIFIFFSVLIGSAGLYFYKGIMNKNIKQMESDLNLAKSRFEPSKIVQLQVLDKRLNASTEILAKHVAISPIFSILQDITMKSVQYTNFTYSYAGGPEAKIEVTMKGQAVGYRSVALQSDLFAEHESLINPLFSNLSLNDAGNVLFDLDFSVDPNVVNYKKILETKGTVSASEEITTGAPPLPSSDIGADLDDMEASLDDLDMSLEAPN